MSALPGPDAYASPDAILERAVAALAARLSGDRTGIAGIPRQELLDRLGAVAGATRAILDGMSPEEARGSLEGASVPGRLLGSLRAVVLAQATSTPAHAELVLDVLRAMEALHAALFGDDGESLLVHLSQPDSLELLVEVAHDLRSPLTSILFLSETLRSGHSGEVNPQQRSQLGLIYGAALGLASLASDVVDLSREGRGLLDHEPEPFSLAEIVGGVEDLVRPMAEEKGLELRTVVPEYDRSTGHPMALRRVMLNLVANGIKFTDHGYVEFGATRVSALHVEYHVRDTGRGISKERQRELFLPFKRRTYTTGHFFSGSGVGLSMARRLVHLMGSDLVLDTAPDWGTRFSFVLDNTGSRP